MRIDWDRIRELHSEIGDEDFDEVVELFLSEVSEAIDGLSMDVEFKQLEHDMHFIKSSALNIGFRDLSETCGKGESAAAQGLHGGPSLQDIRNIFAESLAEFEERRALANHVA